MFRQRSKGGGFSADMQLVYLAVRVALVLFMFNRPQQDLQVVLPLVSCCGLPLGPASAGNVVLMPLSH